MSSSLDSALSGLRIAQQQLGIISTNIANSQTDGYSRKVLPQSSVVIEGQSVGVRADPVVRKVDMSLTRDLWTQIASTSATSTKVDYLNQIQAFHGKPDNSQSISAEISALKDTFSALSDTPSDTYAQNAVLRQADATAKKLNSFSTLIQQLRTDADNAISDNVTRVNALLSQIADQNQKIQGNKNMGLSSADFEDLRDKAVKELSQYMDIGFFTRGDGTMVIQTKNGVQLADELPNQLYFQSTTMGPDKYYPASANGVYLGGNPSINPNAFDILPYSVGGKIGALADLRDTILPQYQAQTDELAFRMAQRLDGTGLTLFTDEDGQIPADVTPVPASPGPLTPVAHVGFSARIQVNQNITDDLSLLQQGTKGDVVQSGSNEVIRRVIEFGFGTAAYQAAEGARDIRVAAAAGGDTLQENMGLYSSNTLVLSKNLAQFTGNLNVAAGNPFDPGNTGTPTIDDFTMRVYDARVPADSTAITIDLGAAATAYPIGSAGLGTGIGTVNNAAEQLASYINSLSPASFPASMAVTATVNTYGQVVINTRGNVTIGAGSMGTDGLNFLGLAAGTTTTTDPYFDIQVGTNIKNRVTIEPGDTQTQLVTKIAATQGMTSADVSVGATTGYLTFSPHRGGDMKLTGGPFSSVAGFSTAGGNSIIKEIFGSDNAVVTHNQTAFRTVHLGPNAAISSGILGATTISDFAQKLVTTQTQDQTEAQTLLSDGEQYQSTLQKKLLDQSGVNVDEELANMVVIQSAYAAAARAISVSNEMFKQLLDSFAG